MSDSDIGWDESVYGDAIDPNPGWPDMDAPHPFPSGDSASGFGTSRHSTFTGYPGFDAKVPGMSGFSGLPVEPEPPQ